MGGPPHEVVTTAKQIEAAAVDMETGMRGFLLAGKDEFLEPYNNGKAKFEVLVSDLSKTVANKIKHRTMETKRHGTGHRHTSGSRHEQDP